MKALRAISNCVLTNQRKMQQDKAAAKPPETNQHEGKFLQSGWVQVKLLQKAVQQNHAFCAHIGIQKKEEKKEEKQEEKKEVCCVLCARYKIVGAGFLRPRAKEQWMLLQVAIGKKWRVMLDVEYLHVKSLQTASGFYVGFA